MRLRFVVLVATCFGVTPLVAQDLPPRFGVGVDLSSRLTLAVALNGSLRLQPEVAFTQQSADIGGGVSGTERETLSLFHAGAGLFLVRPLAAGGETLLVYAGPRGGVELQHASILGGVSNQTDWWVGLACGGEYFLGRHFSLGGEAQVTRRFAGKASQSAATLSPFAFTTTDWETRGLLLVRFYPW